MHLESKMKQEKKDKSNIILIGMPGSGKSTVGVILAKMLAKRYLDTDILLQNIEKRSLQEIVDTDGHMALQSSRAAGAAQHTMPESYRSNGRQRRLQRASYAASEKRRDFCFSSCGPPCLEPAYP